MRTNLPSQDDAQVLSRFEIKQKYDPENIFRVHHGVGSELPV